MTLRRCTRLVALLLPLTCVASRLHAQAPPLDWAKANKETLDVFSSLIRIDSSNPPGNETKVATYIKGILDKEGIPSILAGGEPDRLSIIARLKGNGSKKPILIFGHTDVVGVQREHWSEDPFGAKSDRRIYLGAGHDRRQGPGDGRTDDADLA